MHFSHSVCLSAGSHSLSMFWIPDVNGGWILKMQHRKNLQTQAWSCLNPAEVKAEQNIQIKHLYEKHDSDIGTDHDICKGLWV